MGSTPTWLPRSAEEVAGRPETGTEIKTSEFGDAVIAAKAQMLDLPAEQVSELYHNQSSLGRLIEAEDIANMALYLASEAAAQINGASFSIDGGWTAH